MNILIIVGVTMICGDDSNNNNDDTFFLLLFFSQQQFICRQTGVIILSLFAHLLPQVLPCSRNVRHVFVQDVLLGADAVILNVLGPVQLAHVKVKSLQRGQKRQLVQT